MEPATSINEKPGWLGFRVAVVAFVQNMALFAAPQPRTPLRVLSLMAISSALRSRGVVLQPDRRLALINTMELGALLNDRFDGDPHNPADLRRHVALLSQSVHRDCTSAYISRLRRLERSRPGPRPVAADVKAYRENVNRISLATLWAIAAQKPIEQAKHDLQQEPDLRLLFRIVMLAQLIDDVLDIRQDRRRGLPTFATASDADLSTLRATVSDYRNPAPLDFDGNFCLHLILRMAARSARTAIDFRGATGLIPGGIPTTAISSECRIYPAFTDSGDCPG